jgi:preprotein translocase subunit YajC
MGKELILAATTKSGSSSSLYLIGFVVLIALLYFVMIRPQRNRQRQAQQTQREVVPGSRVRTTAGMYATVTEVDGQDVVLEIAPGVEVRYMRRAIMDVVPDDTGTGFAEPHEDVHDPEDEAADPAEHSPEHRNEAEDDAATG